MFLAGNKTHIKLSSVRNFRDLGGLRSQNGGIVKSGLFLRSGHLANISLNDINQLIAQKISSIIDLRTPNECINQPDSIIKGIDYLSMPIYRDSVLGITHEIRGKSYRKLQETFSIERIRSLIPDMPKLYQSMVTNKQARNHIAEIMHQIIRNACQEKGTLFHCTVGKDRTGLISALVLSALDVDEETITEDYMLSNAAIRIRTLFMGLGIFILKKNLRITRDFCNAYLVKRANIQAVFESIRQDFGSMQNFFRNGLGISDAEREDFLSKSIIFQ